MPSSNRRRKKSIVSGVEDYYKILEVRKNASPEHIKQAYVRLVRLFPPETHSNEFQQIRRAYETLRDPAKRRQYDITRQYGTNAEGALKQAISLILECKWEKATKLVQTAIKIDPNFVGAYFLLANIALMTEDETEFEKQMYKAFQLANDEYEQLTVFFVKADMLRAAGQTERALQVLDEAEVKCPHYVEELAKVRVQLYANMERFDEAFSLASSCIPEPKADDAEDVWLFVTWINMMIMSGKWQYCSKINSRMRRFLRSVQAPDDKEVVLSVLHQESLEWEDAGEYRGALMFTEFCLGIAPKDDIYLERRGHLETLRRMENEYERLSMDRDMFPWVAYQALRWYAEFTDNNDILETLTDEELTEHIDDFQEWHMEIAAGILRLKKKYQMLYRKFEDRWDALFAEHAAGLNREERRRLR